MNIYILAEYPFALRLNGKTVAKKTRYCELTAGKDTLLEVLPLNFSPARAFALSEDFFSETDENTVKVRMEKGAFIKLKNPRAYMPYRMLFQKRLAGALATAYADGVYKFALETQTDYRLTTFDAEIVDAGEFYAGNRSFIYARAADDRLACFHADGKIECVFDSFADSFGFDGGFYTERIFRDAAAHRTKTFWNTDKIPFTAAKSEVVCGAERVYPDILLPYLLAEALLAGDDPSRYLSGKAKENAHALLPYFGNFCGVFPPPKREGDLYPRILYKIKEGLYRTKTLKCTFAGGKIENLTLV